MPSDAEVSSAVDKVTHEAVRTLFARAEDAIKRYERITLSVLTPAVNQLRYAGHHLLEGSLEEACRHCARAYYDALECSISELLGFFARFYEAGYSEGMILKHLPEFPQWRNRLKEAQSVLIGARRLKTLTDEEITALEETVVWLIDRHLELRDVMMRLEDERCAEERLFAEQERQAREVKLETEIRRENRRYWHSMTVAYASIFIGIVSLIIAILSLI